MSDIACTDKNTSEAKIPSKEGFLNKQEQFPDRIA